MPGVSAKALYKTFYKKYTRNPKADFSSVVSARVGRRSKHQKQIGRGIKKGRHTAYRKKKNLAMISPCGALGGGCVLCIVCCCLLFLISLVLLWSI
jgi:hypothetical protein